MVSLLKSLLFLLSGATTLSAWIISPQQSHVTRLLAAAAGDLDDASNATPLSLSENDLARLVQLRNRHKKIPIMILDAMLPGQRLEFSLRDKRFRVLAERLRDNGDELGMIGFDPSTGNPLNVGVTVKIQTLKIEETICTLGIEGYERFEVQGEPIMDETGSYYMADVEVVEGRSPDRELSMEQLEEAKRLHSEIPDLIQEWLQWLYKTGRATPESMEPRLPGTTMPSEIGPRALWAAAMVNPIPALGVCLEIRPSMLVCQNDLERVKLAHVSLKASIDHLSGKQRLF
jgi:hypothetical protein